MYIYDNYDQQIVEDRVRQFRDQTRRYFAGELTEDEYLPLRLQNGLYVQRHAPMLRIAVPYGLLASRQLRKLADITRKYDKGYAHITTRTNVQLNWPALENVPDILEELASVQMHAIQPAVTASVTPPPTSSQVWRAMRALTRAHGAKLFVSGRPSTQSLRAYRASSKSLSMAAQAIARPLKYMTLASKPCTTMLASWAFVF